MTSQINDSELQAIESILELADDIGAILRDVDRESYSRIRSYVHNRQDFVELPYQHPFYNPDNE